MNKIIISALVAAGFATVAPLSMAQPAGQSPGAGHGHHGQRFSHDKQAFSLPSERVEARLAYIKTALNISDAQQTQWDAFAGVMRKQAKEADARVEGHRNNRTANATGKRPTAIERLERRQAHMSLASTRIGERLAVQKPLYAALTPEQQQIADKVLAGHAGNRGGKRGGHHGGHGRA